ncbi:hypothetical protein JOE63_001332 [Cellulosimicrobium cellulans]|uniref:hypothetical protein n=1 Tax=Cellulosimicrobium cellulans TaxID=1710 RepID=UPI00195DEC84|nr:hypothetical protein [Cellulosimicrobium cellulans]MBM7818855.1 hypothetical protein [Cellulosimicrobium cellulans]
MRRGTRLRVAAALAVALALVGAPAVAWWTASGSLWTTVSAGTVPPPTNVLCANTGTFAARTATVTWTAPTPAPARYRVTFSGGGETATTETTTPQVVVSTTLLGGLLESILDLLLGGQPLQVRVQAVHASGWTSVAAGTVAVRNATLTEGVGIRCV